MLYVSKRGSLNAAHMQKKIIIVGAGGSGKDHLARLLTVQGYTRAVSYTTRPSRAGEVDGADYHFVSEPYFLRCVDSDEFEEWYRFGDKNWLYGTSRKDFGNSDLFIMSPVVLAGLHLGAERMLVVYLNIPEATRRERLISRNDADSVERRLAADAEAFKSFSSYDVEITDPQFTIETLTHCGVCLTQ